MTFLLAAGGQPLSRYLDKTGDGTGDTDMNEDYSGGGGQEFLLAPAATETLVVERLIILIQDAALVADQYGGLGSALSNGVSVFLRNGKGEILNLLNGVPVKTNEQWAGVTHDRVLGTYGSATLQALSFRWTFGSHFGSPLMLRGALGEKLVVHYEDDLSGLMSQRIMAGGKKVA